MVKIISDSTCDLPKALIEKYDIAISPLSIIKDGENFKDNVTITPPDIFAHVAAGGSLCSTAAGNAAEYEEMFAKMQAATLINAGVEEADNGATPVEGNEFFKSMRAKYEK